MWELRSSVIGLKKPEVQLYKSPYCILAGKDYKKDELKLPFVSLSVSMEPTGRSVWVGEYMKKRNCWLSPQFVFATEKKEQDFLIPAWFVETHKEVKMQNMVVKWELCEGGEEWVQLPYLVNSKALKKDD